MFVDTLCTVQTCNLCRKRAPHRNALQLVTQHDLHPDMDSLGQVKRKEFYQFFMGQQRELTRCAFSHSIRALKLLVHGADELACPPSMPVCSPF